MVSSKECSSTFKVRYFHSKDSHLYGPYSFSVTVYLGWALPIGQEPFSEILNEAPKVLSGLAGSRGNFLACLSREI